VGGLRALWRTLNGGTDLTNVDGRNVRPEAAVIGPQALPPRPDAGTVVSVQPGVRGVRQDPVSSPYLKDRSEP